jgi:hypothetical protein
MLSGATLLAQTTEEKKTEPQKAPVSSESKAAEEVEPGADTPEAESKKRPVSISPVNVTSPDADTLKDSESVEAKPVDTEAVQSGAARDPMVVVPTGGDTLIDDVGVTDVPPAPSYQDLQGLNDGLRNDRIVLTDEQKFELEFDGYLRLRYATSPRHRFFGVRVPAKEDANPAPNVGRNDGFTLGAARFNVRGTYGKKLYVRLGFDGAVVRHDNPNSPVGTLEAALKDAYARVDVHPLASVYAGRFKPPFDSEELTPTYDQMFIHRSLESRGVKQHEGFSGDMGGMAPGRQLGLMLGADSVLSVGPAAVGYRFAVTNGNSGDASLNDNDQPAFWLRLKAAWGGAEASDDDEEGPATYSAGNGGVVGLSAFHNVVTSGDAPSRFFQRRNGFGVDAAWNVASLVLQGQYLLVLQKATDFDGSPTEQAMGGHVQAAYRLFDNKLLPGYRFAIYDPRIVENAVSSNDRVMHHTIGLRYLPEGYPMILFAEYTLSVEQSARAVDNDRFEAAMQVTF